MSLVSSYQEVGSVSEDNRLTRTGMIWLKSEQQQASDLWALFTVNFDIFLGLFFADIYLCESGKQFSISDKVQMSSVYMHSMYLYILKVSNPAPPLDVYVISLVPVCGAK
ncbi:hypothetical protein AcV7_001841 [Taiwanofungus camphoratus]|nr:hypothetical protein AcV7_001841 [Antrodia cinnamomea]